jgi:folate-binding protein YgfZ
MKTIKCKGVIAIKKDDPSVEENFIGTDSILFKDLRYNGLGTKNFMLSAMPHLSEGKETCKNQYKILRHMFGIGEGVELTNRIPLECNLDLLRYISFTKGCYIGQELVARTKYKGVVRKRLVPFMTIPPLQVSSLPNFSRLCGLRQELLIHLISKGGKHPEAVSFDEFDGNAIKKGYCKVVNAEDKQVGEVISTDDNGVIGLAIIRLEDLKSSSQLRVAIVPDDELVAVEGKSKVAADGGVNIFPFRPDWFPDIDPITGQDIFHGI